MSAKTTAAYRFQSGSNELRLPVYLIVGASRSGKTLLGNILGTCSNVEYLDEPWLPMMLTIAAGLGSVDHSLAASMVRTYVYEMLNDRILMRHANFRPSDLTSVWLQKTPEEIFSRLLLLRSRADVRKHIEGKKTALVINLTDTLPFADFVESCFPGCRIIHVVHDGAAVAGEILKKGWFSAEELERPTLGQLFRTYKRSASRKTYFMNFWVEQGQEKAFIERSEYGRGLYYWRRMMEMSVPAIFRLERERKLHTYHLPRLLSDPSEKFGRVIEELGFRPTHLTDKMLSGLTYKKLDPSPEALESVSAADWRAVEAVSKKLKLLPRTVLQGVQGHERSRTGFG